MTISSISGTAYNYVNRPNKPEGLTTGEKVVAGLCGAGIVAAPYTEGISLLACVPLVATLSACGVESPSGENNPANGYQPFHEQDAGYATCKETDSGCIGLDGEVYEEEPAVIPPTYFDLTGDRFQSGTVEATFLLNIPEGFSPTSDIQLKVYSNPQAAVSTLPCQAGMLNISAGVNPEESYIPVYLASYSAVDLNAKGSTPVEKTYSWPYPEIGAVCGSETDGDAQIITIPNSFFGSGLAMKIEVKATFYADTAYAVPGAEYQPYRVFVNQVSEGK